MSFKPVKCVHDNVIDLEQHHSYVIEKGGRCVYISLLTVDTYSHMLDPLSSYVLECDYMYAQVNCWGYVWVWGVHSNQIILPPCYVEVGSENSHIIVF